MRVALITPRYPPDRCGVGDYTALLARHLAELGIEPTVITSRVDGWPSPPSPLALTAGEGESGVRVLRIIDDWGWRSLVRLAALLRAGRYDVAHVQYQNEMYGRSASISALPLLWRAVSPRTPLVMTIHDYGTPWPRRLRIRALAGPYGKAWFATMLLASSRVILTNEQDEQRFLRQRLRYPVPARRYVTIPVGSNLPTPPAQDQESSFEGSEPTEAQASTRPQSALFTMRPQSQVPPDRSRPAVYHGTAVSGSGVTVGYFGFVNPAKGVDMLLDAFAAARVARPALRLTLICALRDDDPYHRALSRRLRDPALRDGVTITGELGDDEAAIAMAACDMIVLPFRDGASTRRTTLMAALPLGRPVISTASSAPPAALRDGHELVLVPPGDAMALARAIDELAADPERRDAIGRAAQRAAAAFAWPAIAARTAELYRAVLA